MRGRFGRCRVATEMRVWISRKRLEDRGRKEGAGQLDVPRIRKVCSCGREGPF